MVKRHIEEMQQRFQAIGLQLPDPLEFQRGYQEFERRETRDAMYRVASFLVEHFWGKPADMADGLGVLLLTWNHAFYRYGGFSFQELENCLAGNLPVLEQFRKRSILSLADSDEKWIEIMFEEFLVALRDRRGRRSPVAVSKALHLLAPDFFALWDNKISRAYDCYYGTEPADNYVLFCGIIQLYAAAMAEYLVPKNRTLVKLIDEYNYAKYTKGWI